MVYTSIVEAVLADHTASSLENEHFKKHLQLEHKVSNFEARVLCAGIWPHEPAFDLELPPELQKLSALFEQYFKGAETFRYKNFQWDHLMSKVTLTLYLNKHVPEQKFEWCDLTMNTLQACLLDFVYRRRPYKVSEKEIAASFSQVERKLLLANLNNLVLMA